MFVREGVDVIVAFEDQSIDAAQRRRPQARIAIPVVFLHPSDPLRDGLTKSLSRPGGNLTGVFGPRDVVAKQLEVYQAPRAGAASSAHARRPEGPEDGAAPEASTRAPRRSCNDRSSWTSGKPRPQQDLERIFRSLRPGEVDGAFLLSHNLRQNHSALTIKLAKRARLPVQGTARSGSSRGRSSRTGSTSRRSGEPARATSTASSRGTSPADLPVEEIPKIEFAINLKTASRLGIKVPQEMIIRADEVYR